MGVIIDNCLFLLVYIFMDICKRKDFRHFLYCNQLLLFCIQLLSLLFYSLFISLYFTYLFANGMHLWVFHKIIIKKYI